MQSAMLHDMVSISVGCYRRLVAMLSSVACDTVFCLKNIASIKKVFVLGYVRYAQSPDVIHTARCLLELLYVKHGYSSLSLFSHDELVCAISYCLLCIVYSFFYVLYVRF